MGLLRNYVLVFFLGWGLWFWMDKSDTAPAHAPPAYGQTPPGAFPGYPGVARVPGALPLPQDDLVGEFQHGFDLVKAGGYKEAFVYLWRRQSWVLAGVLTLFVSIGSPRLLRGLTRLRGSGGRSGNSPG